MNNSSDSSKKYSVDDILNEIRSKKQEKQAETSADKITQQKNDDYIVKEYGPLNKENFADEAKEDLKIKAESEGKPSSETDFLKVDIEKLAKNENNANGSIAQLQKRNYNTVVRGVENLESTKDIKLEDLFYDKDLIKNQETIFIEKSKHRINQFKLIGEEEDDEESEKIAFKDTDQNIEEIDDFNSYEDADSVLRDLKSLKAKLLLRIFLTLITTFLLLYIILAEKLSLPMSDVLSKTNDPLLFISLSLALLSVAVICSITAVVGGLITFVKFKPDMDSMLFLCVFGCLVNNVALIFSPDSINTVPGVGIFSIVAMLMLLFNILGKLCIVSRIKTNFKFVSSECEKFSIERIGSANLAKKLTGNNFSYEPVVLKSNKTNFLKGFLDYSYREDLADNVSKIMSPIIFLGAIIIGIVAFVMNRDVFLATTAFSVALCICIPLQSLLPTNFILKRAAKKLVKKGIMISSYEACGEIDEANAVILKSSDLFPEGTISLHAIKTFMGGRIDEAILDAASVVLKTDSTLCELFLNVIAGRRELLKPVDTLVYEDGMGLSAWVDSKRVLIGSRELQMHHGVDVPSKDYEDRYLSDGVDIIYLSTSGVLAAAFLVSYNGTPEISRSLKKLEKADISIVVITTDANLTRKKLTKIFGLNEEAVRIVPATLHEEVNMNLKEKQKSNASIAHLGTIQTLAHGVLSSFKIKSSVLLATAIMAASVIIGYALVSYFVFFGSLSKITIAVILLYQAFWMLVVMSASNIKKY